MKKIRDKVFIDTNIFVYAKSDVNDKHKQLSAKEMLVSLSNEVIISVQVLNEFYNVLSKYNISDEVIQTAIISLLKYCKLKTVTLSTIKSCWNIKIKYKYHYYDCLIIASALENNCSVLYTEDMQHGQLIENKLKIINPFCAECEIVETNC